MKRTAIMTLALMAAASLSAGALAQEMKKIAISTIVEVPALLETKQGIIEGLAEDGFVEGKNLEIDYQNANGNMPTQLQIANKFVGDNPDLIIPITTPTAQAVIGATKDIPIVFASVTDPVKAKLIPQYEQPGGNVTGVSDAAPIKQQMDLIQELVPDLKKIGFIYNPGLDNALATLGWLKEDAAARGIEVVESPAPTTNEVTLATKKLIGNVEAVYVPNDTTIVAVLESIIKIGQEVGMPIFAGETGAVERGAIASVGLNYVELGKVAGHMAARVLKGEKPGTIDAVIAYETLTDFKVVVNKGSAEKMGVTVPESVLARATKVIE